MADAGEYLGSESSFYRVLKQNDLLTHRHNSKPRAAHRPKDLVASKPNEIWSWDITYLNSPRNWSPITEVFLNPKKHQSEVHQESSLAMGSA